MAREFSYGYVYYKRLANSKKPGHKELYNKATANLLTYGENENKAQVLNQVAKRLASLSNGELQKERKLLEFLDTSKVKKTSQGLDWKDIVKAFNDYFQYKDDFNCIIEEIKNAGTTMGQNGKGGLDRFPDVFKSRVSAYLTTQIFGNSGKMLKDIALGNSNAFFSDLRVKLQQQLPILLAETLENLGKNQQGKERYASLIAALREVEKGATTNAFVSYISKIYQLDSFFDKYLRAIQVHYEKKKSKAHSITGFSVFVGKKSEKNKNAGFLEEALRIAQTGLKGEAYVTESGTKTTFKTINVSNNVAADFLIGVNMDDTALKEIEEQMSGGSVAKDIRVTRIADLMDKIDKQGYLIHVSSKLYNLAYFQKNNSQGYKTTSVSLGAFKSVLSTAGIKGVDYDRLIYSILQTPTGAIGDKMREDLSNRLAQFFAEIFFDDVRTIGNAAASEAGGAIIHLVDLNGLYLPLSYMLDTMAKAISTYAGGGGSYKKVVNVSIKKTAIDYPKRMPVKKEEDGVSLWQQQADHAYQNITITTHFFKNIQQLVQEIFSSSK